MLKGTLDDFTLADICRLMSLARRTGKLEVVRSAGRGKVFVREGEVYYAESSLIREPLGQKLIRSGALSEGALMKALDENAASGKRVGEILVDTGAISYEQLQKALQQQIEDAVFDLLRWDLGEFTWEPGVIAEVEVNISVSVENLIIEASRRLDELEVISRKIPSVDSLLKMAQTPPEGAAEINITPEEWRMLVLVDGTRSVHDIAMQVGVDDITALRSLYGLVSAGLAEVEEGRDSIEAAGRPGEQVRGFARSEDDDAATVTQSFESEDPDPSALEPTEEHADAPIDDPDPAPMLVQDAAPVEMEPEAPEHPEEAAESEPFELVAEEPAVDEQALEVNPEDVEIEVASTMRAADGGGDPGESSGEIEGDPLFDEPEAQTTVEEFDSPSGDELVSVTPTDDPSGDPFLNELLSGGPAPTEEPSDADAAAVEDEPSMEDHSEPAGEVHEPEMPEPAEEPEAPAAEAPSPPPPSTNEDSPSVDRADVVRELAGLFDEDRPRIKRAQGESSEEGATAEAGDQRRRVEDDDQLNKGLIGRLIDGVKGL